MLLEDQVTVRGLAVKGATFAVRFAVLPLYSSTAVGATVTDFTAYGSIVPGTMIVDKASSNVVETVITGVAGKKGITSIHVEKDMMNSVR